MVDGHLKMISYEYGEICDTESITVFQDVRNDEIYPSYFVLKSNFLVQKLV